MDQQYFHTEIEPLLSDPLIEYLGEITDAEKHEFLGHAMALVCPYDWPEAFGLVLIEALACGTPVLAYRRGSITEIIIVAAYLRMIPHCFSVETTARPRTCVMSHT